MPVLFACLAIITLVLLAHIIVYRRQVGKLCRQLRFMNENKTMQQPTVDINAKELNELADQIKLMNERLKETEISHLRQDEALRETIANLSHDIRTPLTSLDGYFQLLGSPEITPDKREYYTGIIKSRIASLNDMLDELFTYARLQDPNYEIETAPTDITGITAETVISFYDDIKKIGNEPVINISEDPLIVNADRNSYVRIVQNIIKNALVHGKSLKVSLFAENGKACFVCSDEVLGEASAVDVKRVFDRFYKADGARSTKGSGLGLAISKELTEKMGGEISATCEDGEFTITLRFNIV